MVNMDQRFSKPLYWIWPLFFKSCFMLTFLCAPIYSQSEELPSGYEISGLPETLRLRAREMKREGEASGYRRSYWVKLRKVFSQPQTISWEREINYFKSVADPYSLELADRYRAKVTSCRSLID